ncbi:MAG: metallophosphoesterase [Candidatus Micrarchaeia archaeon]
MRGEEGNRIKFVYNEPALLIGSGRSKALVIGDLHIGVEQKLKGKGVHLYQFASRMAQKVSLLLKEFKAKRLILLGDIKESILYPEEVEAKAIRQFFSELSQYEIKIAGGNHDSHLSEITGINTESEIFQGDFALLHGHAMPSSEAMSKRYIISAHNHIAISIKDRKGGVYYSKAWLVSKAGEGAPRLYPNYNKEIKLVSMPAFNDLIAGTDASRFSSKENLSPLFRNKIFNYESAEVYLLSGEFVGSVSYLSSKGVRTDNALPKRGK